MNTAGRIDDENEEDAGWILIIDLIIGVSSVKDLWEAEKSEGGLENLSYAFMSMITHKLENQHFSENDENKVIAIINAAYNPTMETFLGVNNFLGVAFIENLTEPGKHPRTQSIFNKLRPELQKSYKELFGITPGNQATGQL